MDFLACTYIWSSLDDHQQTEEEDDEEEEDNIQNPTL